MAEKLGKRLICNRCGNEVFLECIGEAEADGGFTRWNKFEEAPEGWETHMVGKNAETLCPECNYEWLQLARDFMAYK